MHQPLSKYNIGDNVSVFVKGNWMKGRVTLSSYSLGRGHKVSVRIAPGDEIRVERWDRIQTEVSNVRRASAL